MDHIIKDEDQGPSKEWGQYGGYRFPNKEQVSSAMEGKTALNCGTAAI